MGLDSDDPRRRPGGRLLLVAADAHGMTRVKDRNRQYAEASMNALHRCLLLGSAFWLFHAANAGAREPLDFTVKLETVLEHDDGKFLWFHPRVAAMPQAGKVGKPAVVMTLQKHLHASDHYSGLYF